jgi:hypothetical protein
MFIVHDQDCGNREFVIIFDVKGRRNWRLKKIG